jgi:O-antigen/teichoic acid export membrane protein
MSRLKQLSKDSLIYGIGGAVGRGISFFLLPIYTRILTPVDYGKIEMMGVVVSLLTAFLSIGMDSAQSFYFFQQKANGKDAQKTVVSSILQWRLTWGLGVILVAGTGAPLINSWLFGGELPWIYFGVSFAGALFGVVMNQSLEIFRLLYRPWTYMIVTVINTLLTAALILVFVLLLHQGIFGFFLGSTIAGLIIGIGSWYFAREYLDFSKWQSEWWPRLLKFGLPLLPAELGFFAMNTADRWFIRHYRGEEALGIFSVAAKFALLLAFVIDMFRKAWWPLAMDALHSDDGPETFRMIARLYIGVGSAAVVYLTFLAPWLVHLLTGPAFYSSYPIIGIMAWQSLFYGFFMIGSAGIWKAEKTYITSILMCLAGIVNITLNYLWVPLYGSMGAALANSVSYFFWVIISLAISERYWPVHFPVPLLLGQVTLGAITVAVLTWYPMNSAQSFIITHVVTLVLILSAIDKSNMRLIIQKIRSYVK